MINGQPLGVGGYLDIGLIDTMEDLFVNFIGAAVFWVNRVFLCEKPWKGRCRHIYSEEKESGERFSSKLQENNL